MSPFAFRLLAAAVLLGATPCVGAPGSGPRGKQGYKAQSKPEEPAYMNKDTVRLAYQLMDVLNPFPVDVVSASSPLAWRVAAAVGKATSLHVSCVYVHLVILISLVLSAVQVKYGGILGKFSNPLMIQHGAPGDGKSIQMWLHFQVLAFFDKVRNKVARVAFEKAVKEQKDKKKDKKEEDVANAEDGDADDAARLSPPAEQDCVFNKGTFTGLGQFLKGQNGVAFFGLHEGKNFLQDAFTNGPGGGVEDLNQIMDHDLYKNHPANNQSKFNVRNVHVVGAILMHLEEIERQARVDDSVFGLARFLVAKFPVVVNKILPDVAPAEIQNILLDDPDYFNNLAYDDVVGGLANILFAAKGVFQKDVPPAGTADEVKRVYSKITGLHTLALSNEVKEHFRDTFNHSVDEIRDDLTNLGGKASHLNKDKTRPLQFIAPVDLLEKTINYLLSKAGVTSSEMADMDGTLILEKLASLDSERLCAVVCAPQ